MTYIRPPETDNPVEFVNWMRDHYGYPPIEQLVFDGADTSPQSCPIALSIKKDTDLKVFVFTNQTNAWHDNPELVLDNGYARFYNPVGVADWIKAWDGP
jgi:hypothetical protein